MEWREEKEREGKEKRGGEEGVKRKSEWMQAESETRSIDVNVSSSRAQTNFFHTFSIFPLFSTLFLLLSISSTHRYYYTPLVQPLLLYSFLLRTCFKPHNSNDGPVRPPNRALAQ